MYIKFRYQVIVGLNNVIYYIVEKLNLFIEVVLKNILASYENLMGTKIIKELLYNSLAFFVISFTRI
jgi:hypothetical protein